MPSLDKKRKEVADVPVPITNRPQDFQRWVKNRRQRLTRLRSESANLFSEKITGLDRLEIELLRRAVRDAKLRARNLIGAVTRGAQTDAVLDTAKADEVRSLCTRADIQLKRGSQLAIRLSEVLKIVRKPDPGTYEDTEKYSHALVNLILYMESQKSHLSGLLEHQRGQPVVEHINNAIAVIAGYTDTANGLLERIRTEGWNVRNIGALELLNKEAKQTAKRHVRYVRTIP